MENSDIDYDKINLALQQAENIYIRLKENAPPGESMEKCLTSMIEILRVLAKDYESYPLLFDYIYFIFMSISFGPELVNDQLNLLIESIYDYRNQVDIPEGILNLYDDHGNRININDL